jgi:hypothetical protein
MSLQYDDLLRNAKLDAIEVAIGASPVLRIRSGPKPANCAAVDSGTVLATLDLPADWMDAASVGVKTKAGIWEDLTADASGTAGHFRIYDSFGACRVQGSFGTSGTDMIANSVSFNAGQSVTVTTFTIRDNNG